MNNIDINYMKEFRKFTNKYIYPNLAYMLICDIHEKFNTDCMDYQQAPQAVIKFHTNEKPQSIIAHNILKESFVNFFNNPEVVNFIQYSIHTEVNDNVIKDILRTSLARIQAGDQQYLSILFNITYLGENNIYLFL